MRRQAAGNWQKAVHRMWWKAALVAFVAARAVAQSQQDQQPERRLVISVPDRKLAVVEDGKVVKVYPVAVGTDATPSPSGTYRVVNRLTNPTYYHAGKVIAAGRRNPLGDRWMGLDRKGYGIHGTNQPKSIGKAASHGCIRMAKSDVEELFARVRVGDAVEIHAGRDPQVTALFAPQAEATTVAAVAVPAITGGMN